MISSSHFCSADSALNWRNSVTSRRHNSICSISSISLITGAQFKSRAFLLPLGISFSISVTSKCWLNSKFIAFSPTQAPATAPICEMVSEPKLEFAKMSLIKSFPTIWSVSSIFSKCAEYSGLILFRASKLSKPCGIF